jgi:RHS repeat-associated protein
VLERVSLHIMDGTQRVALVETLLTDTAGTDTAPRQLFRYLFADHHGSAVLELDDRARLLSLEAFSPYGSSTYQALAGAIELPKRYRFSGKEHDDESGLVYFGLRYYDPTVARWTSCDPTGLRDGVNLYEFVRGSPVTLNDHSGGSWRSFLGGVAVGLGTALVVVAIVATAPISIPTSVAVGLVVAGTAVTGATVVLSARRRDLFNNPISDDQADFQMGGAVGGLLAAPFSGRQRPAWPPWAGG